MATLHDLPTDLTIRIANESYRTWQLMKMICKKHRDILVCYNVVHPFTTPGGCVLATRCALFDLMFTMVKTVDNNISYCIRVTGKRMRVATHTAYYDNITKVMTGNRTIIALADDSFNTICYIKRMGGVYTAHDVSTTLSQEVSVCGIRGFAIYEGARYQQRSYEYIRDNLPEIHRLITVSSDPNNTLLSYFSECHL